MMNARITHCFVLLGLIGGCSFPRGESPTDVKPAAAAESRATVVTYKAFFYPVAVSETASQEVLSAAKKFSKFVTVKDVVRTPSTGGCYMSVDVSTSANELDGYLIVLRDAGGLVVASNTRELDRAYKALERAAKIQDGKWLLPMPSVITSYPSFPPNAVAK